MDAIRTEQLTKIYGRTTAVDHLNLTVKQGELFSLLGVNGAGKTTTVKMLACLSAPSGGDAFLNGRSIVSDTAGVKAVIGISPQETAVAPNLTARENLELMGGVHGFSRARQKEKAEELAGRFGLDGILRKRAGTLSGGWQRRLSIAMALIGEPQILFLDEPALGLDVLARHNLWEIIRSLKGKITIVLTTHSMEEADALSDRVGIMQEGKLLAVGSVEALKERTGTERFEDTFLALVKGEER